MSRTRFAFDCTPGASGIVSALSGARTAPDSVNRTYFSLMGFVSEFTGVLRASIDRYESSDALADAWQGKIEALRRLGRREEAIEACSDAVGLAVLPHKEQAKILCTQARILLDLGRLEEASASFHRVLDLDLAEGVDPGEAEAGLAQVEEARGVGRTNGREGS